jgi:PAS domain-containing protein
MTWPVASVQIDSAISDAAELMLERNFRHLAVVDRSNRLVGLLTEHCLVRPLKLEVLDDALANQIDLSKANAEVRKKIARSERYQRALLDNFPYLVWLKDTESRFLTVNRHMAQAVGEPSTVSAMLGKTDADYYPPEFAEHYPGGRQCRDGQRRKEICDRGDHHQRRARLARNLQGADHRCQRRHPRHRRLCTQYFGPQT